MYGKRPESPAQQPPSQAEAIEVSERKASNELGILMILVPLAAMAMNVIAYLRLAGEFMVIQAPQVIGGARDLMTWSVVLLLGGSAVLVGADASMLGFGSDRKHPVSGYRNGPIAWALGQVLLWVIAFPWYMSSRNAVAPKSQSLSGPAVLLVLMYVGVYLWVDGVMEQRLTQIRTVLGR